jgi:hypothetical protein
MDKSNIDLNNLLLRSKDGSHYDIALVVHEMLKGRFAYVNNKWYVLKDSQWCEKDSIKELKNIISKEVRLKYKNLADYYVQKSCNMKVKNDIETALALGVAFNNNVVKLNTIKFVNEIVKVCESCFMIDINMFSQHLIKNEKPNENKYAYIYLIREREFVRADEPVYKHGKTKMTEPNLFLSRFSAYKKNSQLIMVKDVPLHLVDIIETHITNTFKNMFNKHTDGHEYFIGDPLVMTKEIDNIINKFIDHDKNVSYMQPNVKIFKDEDDI